MILIKQLTALLISLLIYIMFWLIGISFIEKYYSDIHIALIMLFGVFVYKIGDGVSSYALGTLINSLTYNKIPRG